MAQPSKERVRANSDVHNDDLYNEDIEVGRRVLRIEAAGLEALSAVLDESFVMALDILASVEDQGPHRLHRSRRQTGPLGSPFNSSGVTKG